MNRKSIFKKLDAPSAETERPQAAPPDEARLQTVWKLWHQCPGDSDADERIDLLTEFEGSLYGISKDLRDQYCKLRRRFPKLIPLDAARYHPELQLAGLWFRHVTQIRVNEERHQAKVLRNLRFSDFDSEAPYRVALWRAAAELRITKPTLLNKPDPTVEDIRLLTQLIDEYTAHRNDARAIITRQVYLSSLSVDRRLKRSEIPGAYPAPPPQIPRYIFFARLAGLGICSEPKLKLFMADEFLKLPPAEQHRFIDERHGAVKRIHPKSDRAIATAWVTDNRRVFETFRWSHVEIHAAARHVLGDRLVWSDAASMKVQFSKKKFRLNFKSHRKQSRDAGEITFAKLSPDTHRELLTPRPALIPPSS